MSVMVGGTIGSPSLQPRSTKARFICWNVPLTTVSSAAARLRDLPATGSASRVRPSMILSISPPSTCRVIVSVS